MAKKAQDRHKTSINKSESGNFNTRITDNGNFEMKGMKFENQD